MRSRPHKRSNTKPTSVPGLELGQIIRAALGLLDEVGFDGLTMRSLADKLGVKAASLYWHFRNKQDLLGLMADELCAPMHAPERNLPWQVRLRALGSEYRHVLLGHRDAARVLAACGPPSGANILRLTEILLRTLLDAGFDLKDAANAGSLINDYVIMFVLEETRNLNAQDQVPRANTSSWFANLPPDQDPSLVALASLRTGSDADERFQFGTEVLIKGLEARLAKSRA